MRHPERLPSLTFQMHPRARKLVGMLSGSRIEPASLDLADWTQIVALAAEQGVAPVLRSRLKDSGAVPPPEAALQLREAYLANVALNMRLLRERDRILVALRAAQISVIPIKGASFAEALYGDSALRPMADIDLWVQRSHLDDARAVMRTLGYASRAKVDRPPALQDVLTGETQMVRPSGPLVELHWNLFPGEWLRHTARVDERTIWERSRPRDGEQVRELSPEDAIIHLCVHLAVNHQMSGIGLRTLVDLDYARREWAVDWAVVAQRARLWRVSCATWLVLNALAALLGDPEHELPLPALEPSPWRRRMINRFASPGRIADGLALSGGPKRFLLLLLLVDRPKDALLLIWRAAFPERLWLTLRHERPNAAGVRLWLLHAKHLLRMAATREP